MDFTPSLYILAPPAPAPPDDDEKENCRKRMQLLEGVGDILRRVVGLEGRLWLCSALAEISSVSTSVQTSVFLNLFRHAAPPFRSSRSEKQAGDQEDGDQACKQILRMLCESRPRLVARLLGQDSVMLRRFFSGQPNRALQWFQNFAGVGGNDHQFGARALARYAFMHRETSWHELVWKGDRSQAPATVASKPHYFSELNVAETIANFLDRVPAFWHSEELRDSLEDGQFIALDVDFFVEELLARMGTDSLASLLRSYVAEESFAVLCQRILPIVSDTDFLEFINGLAVGMANRKGAKGDKLIDSNRREEEGRGRLRTSKDMLWLEIVLSAGVRWETLSDAVFCNACARNGRELFRLMQGEEHEDETQSLNLLLSDRNADDEQEHWALRRECLDFRKWQTVQWLALEAWLLFYRLSQKNTSPETLEKLMTENGIGFLRTSAQQVDRNELHNEGRGAKHYKERKKSRKRHRRNRKELSRKRKKYSENDNSESGSDVPFAQEDFTKQSGISWRLSIDNYVIAWTKVDVVEHLVNDALSYWLQWTTKRW